MFNLISLLVFYIDTPTSISHLFHLFCLHCQLGNRHRIVKGDCGHGSASANVCVKICYIQIVAVDSLSVTTCDCANDRYSK